MAKKYDAPKVKKGEPIRMINVPVGACCRLADGRTVRRYSDLARHWCIVRSVVEGDARTGEGLKVGQSWVAKLDWVVSEVLWVPAYGAAATSATVGRDVDPVRGY